mmetsp:Transcript_29860/g.96350  ORF Transcript_29860/g.96350 Transcript_29860/m.96350 type:complete len:420 (+) Transcript_29860:1745-3004(+)
MRRTTQGVGLDKEPEVAGLGFLVVDGIQRRDAVDALGRRGPGRVVPKLDSRPKVDGVAIVELRREVLGGDIEVDRQAVAEAQGEGPPGSPAPFFFFCSGEDVVFGSAEPAQPDEVVRAAVVVVWLPEAEQDVVRRVEAERLPRGGGGAPGKYKVFSRRPEGRPPTETKEVAAVAEAREVARRRRNDPRQVGVGVLPRAEARIPARGASVAFSPPHVPLGPRVDPRVAVDDDVRDDDRLPRLRRRHLKCRDIQVEREVLSRGHEVRHFGAKAVGGPDGSGHVHDLPIRLRHVEGRPMYGHRLKIREVHGEVRGELVLLILRERRGPRDARRVADVVGPGEDIPVVSVALFQKKGDRQRPRVAAGVFRRGGEREVRDVVDPQGEVAGAEVAVGRDGPLAAFGAAVGGVGHSAVRDPDDVAL